MTVLHDDGLYRHIRFIRTTPKGPSSIYWFELITVPNALIFRGDGVSYVFSRLEDMFEFFRGPVGQINPDYWAEKVTDGQDRLKRYDADVFKARVLEAFIEDIRYGGVPRGTGRALREQVLNTEYYAAEYEVSARQALDEFEHDGYRFADTWEWDFKDWHWWYLWACHAIVWGIAYYDTGKRPEMPAPAATKEEKGAPQCKSGYSVAKRLLRVYGSAVLPSRRRPVVTVHLPELAGGEQ
jgi:hypothetical protein